MNQEDRTRLRLAYQAYYRVQPSEFEVKASAQRILAELRSRRLQRRRPIKPWLAVGVLLAGALAYAATEAGRFTHARSTETSFWREHGSTRVSEQGRAQAVPTAPAPAKPRPRKLESPSRPAAAPERATPVAEAAPASVKPTARLATRTGRAGELGRAPQPHATWSDVARALDAQDPGRAERSLQLLLEYQSGKERAKARLGLSQLALGQGDCMTAAEHARQVLADPNGGHLRERARSILRACATQTLPPRPPFKD